mmetsp:Transcript_28495/g.64743  ORF Transcript_28495/g.64743 Transcript_28495/m.64743 type:complete len:435 (+) Transcript_28495:624-1928(+)
MLCVLWLKVAIALEPCSCPGTAMSGSTSARRMRSPKMAVSACTSGHTMSVGKCRHSLGALQHQIRGTEGGAMWTIRIVPALRWRAASKDVLGIPARHSSPRSSALLECSLKMRFRVSRPRKMDASARVIGRTMAKPSFCVQLIFPVSCRGARLQTRLRARDMRPRPRRMALGRASRLGSGASPPIPQSRDARVFTTGGTTGRCGVGASPLLLAIGRGATSWTGRIAVDQAFLLSFKAAIGISARSRKRGATGSPCCPLAASSSTVGPCLTPLSPRTDANAEASGSWATGPTWPVSVEDSSCQKSIQSSTSIPTWGPAGRMSTTRCVLWWRERSAKEPSACPGIQKMSGSISARSLRRETQDAIAGTGGDTKGSPTKGALTRRIRRMRSGAISTRGTVQERRSLAKAPAVIGRSAPKFGRTKSVVRRCGMSRLCL